MKKIILFILFSCIGQQCLKAQPAVITTLYKSDIVGTWIAHEGSKSYELTFTTTYMNLPKLGNIEIVIGRIVYKEGNKIIRTTELDSQNPFIFGVYLQRYYFNFSIIDDDRDVALTVDFNISNDLKTATWSNLKESDRLIVRNNTITWRKGTTDLPEALIFSRQQSSLTQ